MTYNSKRFDLIIIFSSVSLHISPRFVGSRRQFKKKQAEDERKVEKFRKAFSCWLIAPLLATNVFARFLVGGTSVVNILYSFFTPCAEIIKQS